MGTVAERSLPDAKGQPYATSAEFLAIEPVIRRVVASRVGNPAEREDIVQDALERMFKAKARLTSEMLMPFAVATARNLIVSQARREGRRVRNIHRFVDARVPESPQDEALRWEMRDAMSVALAQLSDEERTALETWEKQLDSAADPASGAMRTKMARIRAKLRVDFLLAFRHVDLSSPKCRPVLLSISAGDMRRQKALQSADHLSSCSVCAELSEPLSERSLALTAMSAPFAFTATAFSKARSHPVASGAAAAGAAAAVAAALVVSAAPPGERSHHLHPVQAAQSSPIATVTPAPSSPLVAGVTIGGSPLPATAGLSSWTGQTALASDASIQSTPTHDGFWIGTSSNDRIWVELVGPLRAFQLVPGELVEFIGTVVADEGNYAASVGLTAADGSSLLDAENAHLDVETTAITILPSK